MAFYFKAGHFVKTTGAAPLTQAVTLVGFTPKALIIWTAGAVVDGTLQDQAVGDARMGFGMATGTPTGEQHTFFSTAETGAALKRGHSQKLMRLLDAGVVAAQCVLQSFDADGFTLNWTTNNAEALIFHYIALGGSDCDAKLVSTTIGAATGNYPITGAGFKPNLIISPGYVSTTPYDNIGPNVFSRLGAAVSASNRWAMSNQSVQNAGSAGWRWHRNDRLVAAVSSAGADTASVDLVSMDSDGCTVNLLSNSAGAPILFQVLCLRLPQVVIGTFTKPVGTPSASHTISPGFVPVGMLLISDEDINRANAASQTGARVGISAWDRTNSESAVWGVPDAPAAQVWTFEDKTTKAAVKVDATPFVEAEATMAVVAGGVSISWNTNDPVATEYGYIAFGDVIPTDEFSASLLCWATLFGGLRTGASFSANLASTASISATLTVNPLGIILNSSAVPASSGNAAGPAPTYATVPVNRGQTAERVLP